MKFFTNESLLALGKEIKDYIFKSKSNWDENDETSSKYIDNRPFYVKEKDIKTLIQDYGALEFIEEDNKNIYDNFTPTLEETVIFTFDGVDYKVTKNGDYYGNKYLINTSNENTGEPFCYYMIRGSIYSITSGNHTVAVYNVSIEEEIKTLDDKFLSKNITRKTDISGAGEHSNVFNDLYKKTAFGDYSHAEGHSRNEVSNSITIDSTWQEVINGHSQAPFSVAFGEASHAEGKDNVAYGEGSHAEGDCVKAIGRFSHAEGSYSISYGDASHAESSSHSYGKYSHSEGHGSTAYGEGSHAEGEATEANGKYSHVEGYKSKTLENAEHAHAEGQGTIASEAGQHVEGRFNTPASGYAHIIGGGNGEPLSDRRNIHTVDWNGNAWYEGDVYVGEDNKILAKKSEIPTKLSSLENDTNYIVAQEGKVLSSNDYTDEDKQKLADLVASSQDGQSDFEENDSTQATFIKNRPFYDIASVSILESQEIELMEQQTANGFTCRGTFFAINGSNKKEIGVVYDVIYNGNIYSLPLKEVHLSSSTSTVLGNAYLYAMMNGETEIEGIEDTGESFVIVWGTEKEGDDTLCVLGVTDNLTSSIRTLAINKARILKKLDEKYLPDNLGGVQADWNETDSSSLSYIKNKPIISADGSIVAQSDWEVNNETDSAFIKNKPFYEINETKELIPLHNEVITFNSTNNAWSDYIVEVEIPDEIVAGTEFKVIYNNVEYNCISSSYMEAIVFGNLGLAGLSTVDTGEPFVTLVDKTGIIDGTPKIDMIILEDNPTDDTTSMTRSIGINYIFKQLKQMNSKFIKDMYYYNIIENVIMPQTDMSFTKASNINCWAFEMNGPVFNPSIGQKYKILWDNNEYICPFKLSLVQDVEVYSFGNLSKVSNLLGFEATDTGEPFVYIAIPVENTYELFDFSTSMELESNTKSITVYEYNEEINKIDNKYLSIMKSTNNIYYIEEQTTSLLGFDGEFAMYLLTVKDTSIFTTAGIKLYITVNDNIFEHITTGNGIVGNIEEDVLTFEELPIAIIPYEEGVYILGYYKSTFTEITVKVCSQKTDYVIKEEYGGSGNSGLPEVSSEDEGKILRVVNGSWAVTSIPNAEEVYF